MKLSVKFIDSSNNSLNKLLNQEGELDIYINAVFTVANQSGFETTGINKVETLDNIISIYTRNSVYKFKLLNQVVKDMTLNYVESKSIDDDLQDLFGEVEHTLLHF